MIVIVILPQDACRYDMSGCQGISPGGICYLRCREPFVGGATQATCDLNNTVSSDEGLVAPESDPGPPQEGYQGRPFTGRASL